MTTNKPLFLFLLGPVAARFGGLEEGRPRLRRKEWALLAYLVGTGQTHRRGTLAGLFCQEAQDPARALRVLLSRIRRQLKPELLLTEEDTIRFNPFAASVDCLEFARLLEGNLAGQSLPQLESAINLYRGEFLEGLSLPDSAEFEIWLLGQRSRTRRLYERSLSEIVTRLIAQESYEAAIQRVQQLLQSSPLLEEAHAQLIWLYTQTGRPEAASTQYELCRELLWRELAVEPSPELESLYQAVASGRPAATFRIMSVTRSETTLPETPDFAGPDLVGRDVEWKQLEQAWQAALTGRGSVVLVSAVAGGGKTRLVQEFGQRLPAGSFLAGRCYESTTALPYHPWPDILEMRLSTLESVQSKLPNPDEVPIRKPRTSEERRSEQLSPPGREYLARLAPGLGQRTGRRFSRSSPLAGGIGPSGTYDISGYELEAMFTAVREVLAPPAGPGRPTMPLLIFLDDLQWAGETSLRLFHFIARRINQAAVLLVGAYRSEEVMDAPALQTLLKDLRAMPLHHIEVSPLSPAAIRLLVDQLWANLPDGYRQHVTAMLAQATGGNALFVTELIRELSSTTLVPSELPIPASVRELIQRRLGQLPHRGRQVIEALAIFRGAATLAELQQISARSEEEVALTVDWALGRGLLQARPVTRPAGYEFLHELVKEAVARQLSQARRELLHRRMARTLEQTGTMAIMPAATLAYHWGMAGDIVKEGLYSARAGEEAAALYAHEEAVRYFKQALELLADSERRVEVMISLGDLWLLTGQWVEADGIYREALSTAERLAAPKLQAQSQGALGRLLELKGLYPDALNWLEQARVLAATGGDKLGLARYTGDIGRVYWRQGAYDSALACCHQALTLSRGIEDQAGIATWLNNLGLIYWHQEQYGEALDCFEEAGQIYRKLNNKVGQATCLGNIGNIYKDQEQYNQALAYYQDALQIDQALGHKMGVARHTGNMGIVYYNLAAYGEALDFFEQALAIDQELGHQEGIARHLGNIGNIYWQWRQFDQTLLYYQRALQIDHKAGSQRGVALHLGNMGVIYSRCGAYERAVACLGQALKVDFGLGNKLGVARHLGNMAELCREQENYRPALAYCDRAIALLEYLHNQFHLSWHYMTKARILAAMEEYEAAWKWNEAGLQAATAVQRQDVLFGTQVMAVYLAAATQRIDTAAAQRELSALLDRWTAGEEQAAVWYELWRLDRNRGDLRDEAAGRYQALAGQTPDVTYRRRYRELTGLALPDAPPLPELPAFVTAVSAVDLEPLLTQIDELIASL